MQNILRNKKNHIIYQQNISIKSKILNKTTNLNIKNEYKTKKTEKVFQYSDNSFNDITNFVNIISKLRLFSKLTY